MHIGCPYIFVICTHFSRHHRTYSCISLKGFSQAASPRGDFLLSLIDQAHEQNSAMVKGDGGTIGLTKNPGALCRWMMSGPEIGRLVNEFEASMMTEAQT